MKIKKDICMIIDGPWRNFIINYIIEIINYKRFVMTVTADKNNVLLIRMISINLNVTIIYLGIIIICEGQFSWIMKIIYW